MLHKAWNSKGEMPYCFPRSSIKFQVHTGQNITDFDPNWAFPDYRPVAAFKSLRFALFKIIRQFSRSRGAKNCQFWPELSVSGLLLQFEFTNGFEMMHKSWCSIEEMPYCFPRSFIKFQGHTGWLIDDLNPIWVRLLDRSQLSNPSDLPCFFLFLKILARCPAEIRIMSQWTALWLNWVGVT